MGGVFGLLLAAELAGKPALFFLGGFGLVGLHIAHVVQPFAAVAVFHGEASAIQGHAHNAPSAVKWLLHRQGRGICDGDDFDAAGCVATLGCGRGDQGFGLLFAGAQFDHQAAQKFGFQLRVGTARLPDGGVFLAGAVHLFHAPVGDEDFGLTVGAAL